MRMIGGEGTVFENHAIDASAKQHKFDDVSDFPLTSWTCGLKIVNSTSILTYISTSI